MQNIISIETKYLNDEKRKKKLLVLNNGSFQLNNSSTSGN